MTEPFRENRKIDPSRGALTGDNTPNDMDRVEIGPTKLAFDEWAAAGLELPDLQQMRRFRHNRLVQGVNGRDYGALVVFDPLNIRYATDCTNMQLWIAHNPARAVFVPPECKMILWDFHNCEHLSAHLPLIGAVGGHDGVKLEEQVLITDLGAVPLSTYRYEAAFLD